MMKSLIVSVVVRLLILNIGITSSAKILAIFPMASYSHQIVYHAICKNLNLRGHQITLITTNTITDINLKNFTQIDISQNYQEFKNINFLEARIITNSQLQVFWHYVTEAGNKMTENIFDHPDFKKIYAPNSNEKFDLVIVEVVVTPAIYAFGHRFKAPLIGISTLALLQMMHFIVGNPLMPSHFSCFELTESSIPNLTYWKRVYNYVITWWYINVVSHNNMYKPQQKIAEKYMGETPSIRELEKNISILFINQQEEISFVRPNVPNVITFGGLHIADNIPSKPLSMKLKEFVNNAPSGFIYVSLGTNLHPSTFSKNLIDTFFHVLSNLRTKVVWKCDIDFPKIPDNIYIEKWFPQQTILAHPNLKLFVYQGGLQSTEEAVHFGIPLVGLPVLADQDMIIMKMVNLGTCRIVDILKVTEETLHEAIMDVLNNKSYKENMLKLKNLIKDKPYDNMEKVIWWIEYVIRHKGADHLRSSIVDESWYQRYDTDVIAFLSIALFIISVIGLYIAYKVLVIIIKYCATSMTNGKCKKKKS